MHEGAHLAAVRASAATRLEPSHPVAPVTSATSLIGASRNCNAFRRANAITEPCGLTPERSARGSHPKRADPAVRDASERVDGAKVGIFTHRAARKEMDRHQARPVERKRVGQRAKVADVAQARGADDAGDHFARAGREQQPNQFLETLAQQRTVARRKVVVYERIVAAGQRRDRTGALARDHGVVRGHLLPRLVDDPEPALAVGDRQREVRRRADRAAEPDRRRKFLHLMHRYAGRFVVDRLVEPRHGFDRRMHAQRLPDVARDAAAQQKRRRADCAGANEDVFRLDRALGLKDVGRQHFDLPARAVAGQASSTRAGDEPRTGRQRPRDERFRHRLPRADRFLRVCLVA